MHPNSPCNDMVQYLPLTEPFYLLTSSADWAIKNPWVVGSILTNDPGLIAMLESNPSSRFDSIAISSSFNFMKHNLKRTSTLYADCLILPINWCSHFWLLDCFDGRADHFHSTAAEKTICSVCLFLQRPFRFNPDQFKMNSTSMIVHYHYPSKETFHHSRYKC